MPGQLPTLGSGDSQAILAARFFGSRPSGVPFQGGLLGRPAKILFDHFADAGNTTTSETDLYSDTTAGGQLTTNGDKIEGQYAGVTVAHATATRQIRAYFGGTLIFDSTAQVTSTIANWNLRVTVMRESSTVVRCMAYFDDNLNLAAYPGAQYTRITGLTLTGTNILKITGTAAAVGAATNDIVAKLGYVEFKPAA